MEPIKDIGIQSPGSQSPGRQSTVPDIYFEGPGRQSKGSRKNFHIEGTTVQETERQVPVSYFEGLRHSGRFVSSISKVQDAESLGRRRTLISKVSGSPEFSWTEFRRFSALWFQPGWNFQYDPGCCRTSISKVKEAERQVPDLPYRSNVRISFILGPGFPFKELQRSQTAGLDISKLLALKFFFVCRYPLFVGIEPTGTMSKPLTTCKCAVKR
ncbi:uncharacterized protein OCT59_007207 [Rhizophagus irregularis]|uniref:uncharacterized protein n=1 Tax=Rhizophagus irregularis TaxID=588596 RepID=UPI003333605E|nr:hypothetical protein OCT59_007207 [Rhizophagus irregularis]